MKFYLYECKNGWYDNSDGVATACEKDFWASDDNLTICPRCGGDTLKIAQTDVFDNEEICISTPKGMLKATLATDPYYPGIYIDFVKTGNSAEESIALVEHNENENTICNYVWATEEEDYTHKIIIEKEKKG